MSGYELEYGLKSSRTLARVNLHLLAITFLRVFVECKKLGSMLRLGQSRRAEGKQRYPPRDS